MDASVQTLEERVMIVSSIDVDGSVEEDCIESGCGMDSTADASCRYSCSSECRTPVLPSAVVHTVTILPLSNAHSAPL